MWLDAAQYDWGKTMTTAYKGASEDKEIRQYFRSARFSPSDIGKSAEILPLIERSQDLARNNGVASGAINTLVDNVVGTGLRVTYQPAYNVLGKSRQWANDVAKQVEELWRLYANSEDIDAARQWNFDELTRLAYKSMLQNGEVFALPYWRKNTNADYKTAIRLIESDHVCNPNGRSDTKRLVHGVEINSLGAPVAYHFAKEYPATGRGVLTVSNSWTRVPVFNDIGRRKVIHYFTAMRPGQLRGHSFLSTILPRFQMLDKYENAELKAAVINSTIAIIVETLSGASATELSELMGLETGEDFVEYLANRPEATMKDGQAIATMPGETVKSFDTKRPNAQFGEFTKNVMKHIATGLNMPVELVEKDFRDSTYSSVRSALLEAWRHFMVCRKQLVEKWAKPVFMLWLEEAVAQGRINGVTWDMFRQNRTAFSQMYWIGPGKGWIDPVKEAVAAEKRIQIGLSTQTEECAQQGLDFENVIEQQIAEYQLKLKKCEEAGVDYADVFGSEKERLQRMDADINQQMSKEDTT